MPTSDQSKRGRENIVVFMCCAYRSYFCLSHSVVMDHDQCMHASACLSQYNDLIVRLCMHGTVSLHDNRNINSDVHTDHNPLQLCMAYRSYFWLSVVMDHDQCAHHY